MISFTPEQRFIVTGASSGIGEGTALLLNSLGATVIGIARNSQRLAGMKEKAARPENVFLEVKDLAEDPAALPAYMKTLKDKYGKFQGLAGCAGIADVKPLQMIEPEDVKRIFDIDYLVPIFLAKGFADRRINNGRGASMVFISSMAAHFSNKGHTIYAGAKAALTASMKCIAREVASQGVRVNCVSPSDILTPMTQSDPELLERKRPHYPLGFGEVSDVANMIVYLLSDCARYLSTQDYRIDSGTTL